MSKHRLQARAVEAQGALRTLHEAGDYLNQAMDGLPGVNRTDFRCLQILGLRGPQTAGPLAEESGLTTGAVTTVLDRLERVAFARRVRDTADRRRVLVEMTPEACARISELYARLVADSAAMIANYSDADLQLACDFLTRGTVITRAHARRVREQQAGAARAGD
ncbi:MAG TPA: MarR family transcriptional regulator [Thermomicrobiales bacterium]|nr:MarR family transcriptional regulator [Thermomicrobiales bacterium]